MTQTLTPADITPMTAMTVVRDVSGYRSVKLHYTAMTSVEAARAEIGDGLNAARSFVRGVCCTECGTENGEIECRDCGDRGCRCFLTQDWHDREWRCTDCEHPCGCRECTD